MSDNDNSKSWFFLQLVLWGIVVFSVFGTIGFCAANIKITTTPPRIVPAPAPTVTPNVIFEVLTEQARASTRVQVITAEAEAESRRTWDAALVGVLFFVPLLIGVVYWFKTQGGSYG